MSRAICEHCKHCIREMRTQRDYCTYYNIYTYAVNENGKCDEFEAKFKPPTNPYKDYLNERFGKDAAAIEKMGNRIGEALGSIQNPYIKNFTVDASVLDNIDYISEIRKCYCQRHVDDKLDTMLYGIRNTERKEYWKMFKMDKVKKVIFNPPATIVYWFDGTKTIVKAQDGEVFDTEKGFAMACTKKFFGNEGNYYKEFRKHGADNRCLSISIDLARTGEFVKSGIEDGILNEVREEFRAGFDKCREIDHKFEELSKLEDYASKSKYIVKRVKEELSNSHWGLKLYVDPDTKPNILDMVIFNDSGKSLRSMCDFDIVELEKLDDAVKTIMKDVRERCI